MRKKIQQVVGVALTAILLTGCASDVAVSASAVATSEADKATVSVAPGAAPVEYISPEGPLADWNGAQWIWADNAAENNTWAEFKKTFTLDTVPENATVKIACDNKYWLWVNGMSVTVEGGLNRGPNEYDTYYDVLDLSAYLTQGENMLEILCWYWGNTGDTTHYITAGMPGLILSSEIPVDDTVLMTGTDGWLARKSPAYAGGGSNPNEYLGEYNVMYDAQKETDAGWTAAIPAGENSYAGAQPWGNLIERPIPQFKDYGLTELSPETAETAPDDNGGTLYKLTLPYNMQITPYIALGEKTEPGADIKMYTETTEKSSLYAQYTTKAGTQAYESRGWLNGDYLYLSVPDGVQVTSLGYRQSGYAVEAGETTRYAGYFDSVWEDTAGTFTGGHSYTQEEVSADNNFYDELWQKSADTLYVCMRDSFMDCPDRERGQYIGDVLNEIEESFYALGPAVNQLSAKAIRQICAGQETYVYEGQTYYSMSSIEPFPSTHEIQIQDLGTAVAAELYYRYTGDTALVQECWQPLYNYLTNFSLAVDGDYAGTIRVRKDKELMQTFMVKNGSLGSWTDWENNQDARIAFTEWWYMSAKAVRAMADVSGVSVTEEQRAWLDEMLQTVEDNFEKFWNSDLKAYATRFDSKWYKGEERADGSHLVDDRVNALAVVSGLADPQHYEDIRNVFMGTYTAPAYKNASIYMERYVIQALYEMGYAEDAMTRLHDRYLDIVNDAENSTLPEFWDGVTLGSTKNHGWSGGGLIALSHYAAGIEPTEAGYAQYRIRPQLGSFTKFTAAVPSQIGTITETVEKAENGLTMTVTIPDGEAEIWVPVQAEQTVLSETATESEEANFNGQTYRVFHISQAGSYTFTVQ